MRVDLGARSFNTDVADGNGTQWYVTGMEGWDSPNLRQSVGDPTSRHGGVLQESLLGTRSVVLTGVAKATTEANFWTAYNYILGITNNLYAPINLKVYEGSTVKRLGVIRGGQPRLAFIGVGAFTFEIPLLAMDPLKYNDATTTFALAASATNAAVVNLGTFGTYPVITTTSSGTVVLKNNTTGLTLTTGSTVLASGAVLDSLARTVMEGTNNRYSALSASSMWWALEPGTNSITNSGTAAVSVTYRDAWI